LSLEETFDEISGKIIVMKCDVKSAVCMKLLSLFNIDSQDALNHPYLGIIDLSISVETMTKYQPVDLTKTDDITTEIVTSFVRDFADGSLGSILRTQINPASPAPSDVPVLALNTNTFKTLSKDHPNKDVFVFFAGPACFNCKAVWPSFEKLVRVLHEGSKSLAFAYVDLTYNELQETAAVFSFPTLRLYPWDPVNAVQKERGVNFEDGPEYYALKKFLEKYATAGEIVPDPAQLEVKASVVIEDVKSEDDQDEQQVQRDEL